MNQQQIHMLATLIYVTQHTDFWLYHIYFDDLFIKLSKYTV